MATPNSGGTFDGSGRPRPDRDRAKAKFEASQRFDQTKGGVLFNGPNPPAVAHDRYTVTPAKKDARKDALIRRASGRPSSKVSPMSKPLGGDGKPGTWGMHV